MLKDLVQDNILSGFLKLSYSDLINAVLEENVLIIYICRVWYIYNVLEIYRFNILNF